MHERPILFSAPMVRAILAGDKTQTRRILKPQPPSDVGEIQSGFFHPTKIDRSGNEYPGEQVCGAYSTDGQWGVKSPYGGPGARLWVRETWAPVSTFDPSPETGALYRADPIYDGMASFEWRWRPSIHMPRWASRITLEVTGVRVERVQEINEVDARAEGVEEQVEIPGIERGVHGDPIQPKNCSATNRERFAYLWSKINGPDSWEANPWVWVVEFKRVEVAA